MLMKMCISAILNFKVTGINATIGPMAITNRQSYRTTFSVGHTPIYM